jgi:hypothetical protein
LRVDNPGEIAYVTLGLECLPISGEKSSGRERECGAAPEQLIHHEISV